MNALRLGKPRESRKSVTYVWGLLSSRLTLLFTSLQSPFEGVRIPFEYLTYRLQQNGK